MSLPLSRWQILICLLGLAPAWCGADQLTVLQAKTQLKQLDKHIDLLKLRTVKTHHRQRLLQNELTSTEKKIEKAGKTLQRTQAQITTQQQHIKGIEQELTGHDQALSTQQQTLTQQLRARYHLGEYQPLKSLLNQDDPNAINRLLTYYQYLMRAQQQSMQQVIATQQTLKATEQRLQHELLSLRTLQQQILKQQQQLAQTKSYQRTLLHSLANELHIKQEAIAEYQTNRDHLTALLKIMSQKNVSYTKYPFPHMRKKLPLPVLVPKNTIKKLNQGLTFPAPEGKPVITVYPGKVLFSDWLRGYGLLIIIDHGQGYISLYAYNQSLFKNKGELVVQGEQIATVGHSGGLKENGLYFELRYQGKAISPLVWFS